MALRDDLQVMIVDDMSTSRGLINQALDEMGVRNIDTVDSGKAAVRRLATHPVHLVISDYNMPEMDGLYLLQNLRSTPATKGVGFILITGRAEPHVIEHGQKMGMNNYITKPFSVQGLRTCVEAVVGRL